MLEQELLKRLAEADPKFCQIKGQGEYFNFLFSPNVLYSASYIVGNEENIRSILIEKLEERTITLSMKTTLNMFADPDAKHIVSIIYQYSINISEKIVGFCESSDRLYSLINAYCNVIQEKKLANRAGSPAPYPIGLATG